MSGYGWGLGAPEAEARAAQHGGWKAFARHESRLARSWCEPAGRGLRVRVLEAGHHWVPSILMDEASRELVTCSYDGTVRFWTDASGPRPTCFKVLTAGGPQGHEGFSCIAQG